MTYLVKITATNGKNTFVEFAGMRGVRSLHSLIDADGWIAYSGSDNFIKPRKIEGWKTLKGAEKYIESEKKLDKDRTPNWQKEYEIVSE